MPREAPFQGGLAGTRRMPKESAPVKEAGEKEQGPVKVRCHGACRAASLRPTIPVDQILGGPLNFT